MKKLLALVLALVMTLSLCVTSNAAYKDAADVDLNEAVDVLTAVGVFQGDNNGNMNPKANLKREEAAKLVAYLQLGQKAADALVGSGKFSDVAKTAWSAGYVDYCASTGIVNGIGGGKFDPAGSLTALQFGKMLLVCLGYDAKAEGLTGADWTINTSKLMTSAELLDNLDDVTANSVITREQAAQMMLNALKAPMVEYANKATSISVNGAEIDFGGSIASFVTGKIDSVNNIVRDYTNDETKYGIIELGEKLFPKLVLKADVDAFGRPARTWVYDKKEIGTYVDSAKLVATYTTTVAGKDVYADLGKTVVDDYTFYVVENGASVDSAATLNQIHKTNKNDLGISGKGRLIEVYVDNSAEYVVIVAIDTFLAQAQADYNAKKNEVKLTVWVGYGRTSTMTVSGDDFDVAEVKEDDFFLITATADGVETLEAPDVMSGVSISEYTKKTGKVADKLTVDGTSYAAAAKAFYDGDVLNAYTNNASDRTHLKEATYDIYTYELGDVTYVIGVEEVEAVKNYVFITGVDEANSNLSTKNYDANAIFTDGTSKVIKVKNNDVLAAAYQADTNGNGALINTWFSYKVSSDDVYTLAAVAGETANGVGETFDSTTMKAGQSYQGAEDADHAFDIDKKHISLAGNGTFTRVYGNDSSVYLTAERKEIIKSGDTYNVISGVDSVATGISKVSATVSGQQTESSAGGVYTLFNDKGYVIAAVIVGEDSTVSDNVVYALADSLVSEKYDSTTETWTWTRKVILNGEEVVLSETNDTGVSALENMSDKSWYLVKYKADETVKSATLLETDLEGWDDSVATNTKHVYVDSIEDAATAVAADVGTVVMMSNYSDGMVGTTGNVIYEGTDADKGVYVDSNVKTVLSQIENNKRSTTYLEGFTALKNLLGDLNDRASDYDMSLVIKDGRVTSVVVYDYANDGWTGTDVHALSVTPDASVNPATFTVTVPYSTGHENGLTPCDKAIAALKNAGYTVQNARTIGDGEYGISVEKNGIGYSFNTETKAYYLVKFEVADGAGYKVAPTSAYVTNSTDGDMHTFKLTFTKNGGATFAADTYELAGDGLTATSNVTLASAKNSVTFTVYATGLTEDVTIEVECGTN